MDALKQCWIWRGEINKEGYGVATLHNRKMNAHRFAYIFYYGAIPKGHEIHHTCENKACVNPFHLKCLSKMEHLYAHPIHVGVHAGKNWKDIGLLGSPKERKDLERRAKMWKEFKARGSFNKRKKVNQ